MVAVFHDILGAVAGFVGSPVVHGRELFGIDELRHDERLCDAGFASDIDLRTSHIALLGGDEDDAVGAPDAVHGRGRSVLEDGEGGNVVRVHEVDVPFYTVHKDQRLHASLERGDAADVKVGGTFTRLARTLYRHHTGQLARETAGKLCGRDFELLGIDRCDGAHHGLPLLGAVTHHDDFVEGSGLQFHLDIDLGAAFHGNLLVVVTEGGEDEDATAACGVEGDAVVAVQVGDYARDGVFQQDTRTNHRLAKFVEDRSFDGQLAALRKRFHRQKQQRARCRQADEKR